MRFSQTQSVAIVAAISHAVSAIPLHLPNINLIARGPQPQSYSVVPVDGGSTTATTTTAPPPAATKTVTDAVTVSQIQTSVVLSTIIATVAGASPSTQVIQQTMTSATTVTIEPTVTSRPFDDGQWHTTYYFKSTLSSEAETAAVAAVVSLNDFSANSIPAATATPTVDPGQWAAWAGKGSS